eukprot:551407-Alexandrium_andersonii.AAC.1
MQPLRFQELALSGIPRADPVPASCRGVVGGCSALNSSTCQTESADYAAGILEGPREGSLCQAG